METPAFISENNNACHTPASLPACQFHAFFLNMCHNFHLLMCCESHEALPMAREAHQGVRCHQTQHRCPAPISPLLSQQPLDTFPWEAFQICNAELREKEQGHDQEVWEGMRAPGRHWAVQRVPSSLVQVHWINQPQIALKYAGIYL